MPTIRIKSTKRYPDANLMLHMNYVNDSLSALFSRMKRYTLKLKYIWKFDKNTFYVNGRFAPGVG